MGAEYTIVVRDESTGALIYQSEPVYQVSDLDLLQPETEYGNYKEYIKKYDEYDDRAWKEIDNGRNARRRQKSLDDQIKPSW